MSKKDNSSRFEKAMVDIWEPKAVGDVIEGTVIKSGFLKSDNGEVRYVDILCNDGSRAKVFLGSAQLQSYFDGREIHPGDEIGIRYDGESEEIKKKGNAMKLYSCYHESKVSTL